MVVVLHHCTLGRLCRVLYQPRVGTYATLGDKSSTYIMPQDCCRASQDGRCTLAGYYGYSQPNAPSSLHKRLSQCRRPRATQPGKPVPAHAMHCTRDGTHLQVEQLLDAGGCSRRPVQGLPQQACDGLPVPLTQQRVAQVTHGAQDLLQGQGKCSPNNAHVKPKTLEAY
jgi:hypothetical protein